MSSIDRWFNVKNNYDFAFKYQRSTSAFVYTQFRKHHKKKNYIWRKSTKIIFTNKICENVKWVNRNRWCWNCNKEINNVLDLLKKSIFKWFQMESMPNETFRMKLFFSTIFVKKLSILFCEIGNKNLETINTENKQRNYTIISLIWPRFFWLAVLIEKKNIFFICSFWTDVGMNS